MRLGAVMIVTVALTTSGCGGESDEEQVAAVVEATYAAYAAGDGETFCANISEKYRHFLERGRERSCEEQIATAADELSEEDRPEYEHADVVVEGVYPDGSGALTTVNDRTLGVTSEDGEWKLKGFFPPGAP